VRGWSAGVRRWCGVTRCPLWLRSVFGPATDRRGAGGAGASTQPRARRNQCARTRMPAGVPSRTPVPALPSGLLAGRPGDGDPFLPSGRPLPSVGIFIRARKDVSVSLRTDQANDLPGNLDPSTVVGRSGEPPGPGDRLLGFFSRREGRSEPTTKPAGRRPNIALLAVLADQGPRGRAHRRVRSPRYRPVTSKRPGTGPSPSTRSWSANLGGAAPSPAASTITS
jgi:hypothetical protein